MNTTFMYKIVNLLFKWENLRKFIFAQVDYYNSISRILADPEEMKTASVIWCESDGWRGWHIKDDGKYYFHDLPEKSLSDVFDIIYYKEEEKQYAM